MKKNSSVLFALTLCLCPFVLESLAHPHIFVDVMAKFILTDSTLSGVNVLWDFDEMTSAPLIEEFDINGNGRFEKQEYLTLEREAFSYAANSNYFTVLTWARNLVQINSIKQFTAIILPDKKIRYSFFISLDIKLTDIGNEKVVLFFNDPSMFVAFDLKKNMIQSSENSFWSGEIKFEKQHYYDIVVFTPKKKPK